MGSPTASLSSPVPGILIIAHAPLASALRACAEHVYGCAPLGLEALDVAPDVDTQALLRMAERAIARLAQPDGEVLVLADTAGATPCNTARRLVFDVAGAARLRLVGGVNLPMLLRCLCYRDEGLDRLVDRAIEGGRRAITELEADAAVGSQAPSCEPCAAAAATSPCPDSTS